MKKLYIFWLFVHSGVAIAGPDRIEDLSAVSANGGTVLKWTAPKWTTPPPETTTLTKIDVRYGTSPINPLNWPNKPRVTWLVDPGKSGTEQNATITGLSPNTTYYFAVKVQDSTGSWSLMSNEAHVLVGDSTYKVDLAWDPSPSADVDSYKIYVGTVPGLYVATNQLGNVTTGTVTGLTWGVTYYYAATAIHTNGVESAFSNEISHRRP